MKTKTLRISVIAMFAAILTLGISSCSGGGQGNQDHGSHKMGHGAEAGNAEMAEFQVNGNCGMCKQRIEAAATSVGGANFAEWNRQDQKIKIAMNEGASVHEVHMAIASAGHDTEMHRATDEAYNNLHACCKYERE